MLHNISYAHSTKTKNGDGEWGNKGQDEYKIKNGDGGTKDGINESDTGHN